MCSTAESSPYINLDAASESRDLILCSIRNNDSMPPHITLN